MNLLLLTPDDYLGPDTAVVRGRRCEHVRSVHQAALGQSLRVGMLNGKIGLATVLALHHDELRLHVELDTEPPPKLPLTILLSLPRPKMLKRILQHVATLGVARLVLMNSYRVEKSFWQSPWLAAEALREQLLLGLEQARDTVLPEVMIEPRFKPFVEDRLPALAANTQRLLAHPGEALACPVALNAPVTLAIGPEGGFIPYEVNLLQAAGFHAVHIGPRILRVETAVTALTSRLFTQ